MKPTISYIICSGPRSGSHLLMEALQNTQIAGNPDEYFIIDKEGRLQNQTGNIADIYGPKPLLEFRDLVLDIGSTPNGVFGISIFWNYLDKIVANYHELPEMRDLSTPELLSAVLYNPKYIWLTRRDKVRQAVSLSIAGQTRVWRQTTPDSAAEKRRPEYNYLSIDGYRRNLEAIDAGWNTYFKQNRISPYRVVYEELVNQYEETAVNIIDFLGIPHQAPIEFRERRLQKQANTLNEAWTTQYIQERRRRNSQILSAWDRCRLQIRKVSVRTWLRQHF